MTRYVTIKITEKQLIILYQFISREGSFIDSGDSNFDSQVKKLDKKLLSIKDKLGL